MDTATPNPPTEAEYQVQNSSFADGALVEVAGDAAHATEVVAGLSGNEASIVPVPFTPENSSIV